MKTVLKSSSSLRRQATVGEFMTRNPLSISHRATLWDAATFLTEKDISAAPVINDAGRPIGVVSRTDIVRHVGLARSLERLFPEYSRSQAPSSSAQPFSTRSEATDRIQVREIMTPLVFSITPDTTVKEAVEELLGRGIHRLFVVDDDGVLIGVVAAFDLLKSISPR